MPMRRSTTSSSMARRASVVTRHAKCGCGDTAFAVRLDANEQVGLVTCARRGHSALLLDSRDIWGDVIQTGRPKEQKCRCGGKQFAVDLVYTSRDGDVRSVGVVLRCTRCKAEREAATFEIDYRPTTALVKRPLDPCPEPWLKAKQTTLVGYWTVADATAVVKQLDALGAMFYVAGLQERPAKRTARDAIRMLSTRFFDLYFTTRAVTFPESLRDCWKRLPAIHLGSPIHVNLPSGSGTVYYLAWAAETIEDGVVVPQDAAFLALAKQLHAWMPARFAKRGPRTFHSAAEVARLRL